MRFAAAFLQQQCSKHMQQLSQGLTPSPSCCCWPHASADGGQATSEKVARLCGDNLEHAYEALRLTTSGTSCVSCCYHALLPNTVICSTSVNSINCYDTAHGMLVSQQSKGPRRCSNAFNPSLSHVAVYGDPMAPAIELQLCSCNKFAFLEGPTAEGEQQAAASNTHGALKIGSQLCIQAWSLIGMTQQLLAGLQDSSRVANRRQQ